MPIVLQNIIRFILLVLLQVLVLNNIQFLGYINPYLYILIILAFPVQMPRWLTLILAFGLGLIIDAFANTMGMHAFATVLVAFLRNGIIKLFTSIEEGNNPTPSFYSFGVSAYVKYVVLLVLIHHATLLMLEAFSFVNFGITLTKIILSTAVTVLMILGIQSLSKK
ncbi:rod shape-determining protein MreD [Paludibacter propionicigenes WB4]|uniref:Rod shape-determining protein MreD n=1 Tax=Paludibacter propionicigenes (strain DSM 17365 / JCM 13257 / WB4) TaxID=694427 RepID=E4T652_PALPW|nr:rod shape-determining protein MreD [Paludibacter propionicigenes]ADQ80196.1 rod shape-determining protein MreD [Paludibacter propionicigenes WB4]